MQPSKRFLEAHELAFQHLGGGYRSLRYDNLGSAVNKILRGHRREETARCVAFRSHWGFESSFWTPGEGHEKGGIEAEVGHLRRNNFAPAPRARNLEEVNAMLLPACREDQARTLDARQRTSVRRWLSSATACCRCRAMASTWWRSALRTAVTAPQADCLAGDPSGRERPGSTLWKKQ